MAVIARPVGAAAGLTVAERLSAHASTPTVSGGRGWFATYARAMASRPLPTPSLVVLVGPPACGKSTWAAGNFAPEQIVCADTLRGVVGEHELDLAATADAFEVLDRIVEMRLGRGLTTVVDTTGLDEARRRTYLDAAQAAGVTSVAVRFSTTAAECRRRNRERAKPVPAKALDTMIKKARTVDLAIEGWDLILEPEPVRMVTEKLAAVSPAAASPAADPAPATVRPASSLRFGLLVSRFDADGGSAAIGPTIARVARDAEAAGFDSLWVMDHLIQIPQVGSPWDPMLESYTTLGYLAAATDRIRLGVLVAAVTLRHVGHLAKLVSTLDVLSGGRAIIGLGAGSSEHEHRALGIPFGSPGERLARLEDALQALPLLLGPGSPEFAGRTMTIPEAAGYPRPIQDHVPIIVGGSGERVTLRLAAQYADGCNLFGDATAVAHKVRVLSEHCEAAGRDPHDVEVTHLGNLVLGRDPSELRRRIEQLRPADVGPARFAERSNAGTIDDHEAGFHALAAAGVQTAIVSTPDLGHDGTLPAFGELIARFVDRSS